MITVRGSVYKSRDYCFFAEAFKVGLQSQRSKCRANCADCAVRKACQELESALKFVSEKSSSEG